MTFINLRCARRHAWNWILLISLTFSKCPYEVTFNKYNTSQVFIRIEWKDAMVHNLFCLSSSRARASRGCVCVCVCFVFQSIFNFFSN